MGNILSFPLPGAPTAPAPRPAVIRRSLPSPSNINVARRRYMDLGELAQRLFMEELSRRTLIDRLRGLHDHAGMPAPRNPRFVDGQPARGARAIHAASKWDRGEMLAWLDNGDGGTGTASAAPGAPAPATDTATRRRLHDAAARLCSAERKRA